MPPRSASSRASTKAQAPVTHGTGPGFVRQAAWYFRRVRGINGSQRHRKQGRSRPDRGLNLAVGVAQAEPDDSREGRPLGPRTPRSGPGCGRSAPDRRRRRGSGAGASARTVARQPAFTPAANPPFWSRTMRRTPSGGSARIGGMGPSEALSTTTIWQRPLGERRVVAKLRDEARGVWPTVVVDDDDRQGPGRFGPGFRATRAPLAGRPSASVLGNSGESLERVVGHADGRP